MDFSGYTAMDQNGKIELPSKEIDRLRLFVEHRGLVLSRSQILGALWGDDNPVVFHLSAASSSPFSAPFCLLFSRQIAVPVKQISTVTGRMARMDKTAACVLCAFSVRIVKSKSHKGLLKQTDALGNVSNTIII